VIAWLQPELTCVALCWRLDRRDGVMMGFTSHDRGLAIDGLDYRAAPGMLPSAISLSDGFDDMVVEQFAADVVALAVAVEVLIFADGYGADAGVFAVVELHDGEPVVAK